MRIIYKKARVGAPPVDPLVEQINKLLELEPDVLFQSVKTTWEGEQVLYQNSARTTEVTSTGQTIGAAKNLGTEGGWFESTGTERPVYSGPLGARFDGIDDIMSLSLVLPQPFTAVVWVDVKDAPVSNVALLYAIDNTGSRGCWALSNRITHNHNSAVNVEFADVFTRGQLRVLSRADGDGSSTMLRADDKDGFVGGNDNSSGSLGIAETMRIGNRFAGDRPLLGNILCVAAWDRSLSTEEIDSLPKLIGE